MSGWKGRHHRRKGRAREGAPHKLTERQQEVVLLIAEGCSRTEIAGELDLSVSTVRDTIALLKDYYQCEAHDLPRVTGVKNHGGPT